MKQKTSNSTNPTSSAAHASPTFYFRMRLPHLASACTGLLHAPRPHTHASCSRTCFCFLLLLLRLCCFFYIFVSISSLLLPLLLPQLRSYILPLCSRDVSSNLNHPQQERRSRNSPAGLKTTDSSLLQPLIHRLLLFLVCYYC